MIVNIRFSLLFIAGLVNLLFPCMTLGSGNNHSVHSQLSQDTLTYIAHAVKRQQSVIYKGLEWEQSAYSNPLTWKKANSYCSNMKLSGHTDWRLPTKDELKSLVKCSNGKSTPLPDWEGRARKDDEKNIKLATCCAHYPSCDDFDSPTIDDLLMSPKTAYWTSTIDNNGKIWGVNFFDGRAVNGYYAEIPIQTRCVRNITSQ